MSEAGTDVDWDVAVIGCGPAGCSAGVFTARYGLDTVVFDRGVSSLRRCAHLENYPGFPAGIDIETFYALLYDHAETAGCDVVTEMVESVQRDRARFCIETDAGRRVTADRVIAATRYGGEYLKSLDESAFESLECGERFDHDYADADGRTPIDGLYVAGPAGEPNAQAIIAAGHGGRVARTLLSDYRRERGYPDAVADHWDWLRREAERREGWREEYRTWFQRQTPDSCDEKRLEALLQADLERRQSAFASEAEIERRRERAHKRLTAHLDDEALLEGLDDETMLEYLDDERMRAYLDGD